MNMRSLFLPLLLSTIICLGYVLFFSPQIGLFAHKDSVKVLPELYIDENTSLGDDTVEEGTEPTTEPAEEVQAAQTYNSAQPTVPPLLNCTLYTGRVIRADQMTCNDFTARHYDPYEKQSGNAQNSSGSTPSTYSAPTATPYHSTAYPPCTLTYHFTGSTQTVTHLSPDECAAEQAKNDQRLYEYVNEAASQQTGTNAVTECRSNVTNKYEGLLQSCSAYGGSTREGCLQIYGQERDAEYKACG
jgi:hypothetical protein